MFVYYHSLNLIEDHVVAEAKTPDVQVINVITTPDLSPDHR
jgi:hypothetical protein